MGWDGRPVTRTCHADASDLQGLKATLIEHEKARIGFKNKIRHGVFSGGELSGGRIGSAAPASLVEMISRHLSDIEASGETAALVYDIGISGQQYALCVWLFSAKGMEAAVTAPITEQSPFRLASAATMVRSGLDVEGRCSGPRTAASPRSRRRAALAGKGACFRAGDRRGLVAADAGRDLGKATRVERKTAAYSPGLGYWLRALRGAAVG